VPKRGKKEAVPESMSIFGIQVKAADTVLVRHRVYLYSHMILPAVAYGLFGVIINYPAQVSWCEVKKVLNNKFYRQITIKS